MAKFLRELKRPRVHEWFDRQKKKWYASVPKPKDPNELGKGKTFICKDDSGKEVRVKAERIVGNLAKPHYFELNGSHLISILEFYCQLNGKRPSQEELAEFHGWEAIQVDIPRPKSPRENN